MSKKFHFHACDIRVVYEQRNTIEHCFLWRDLDNPNTNCGTMDDIFNALETRYDGWRNVEWEDEFNLAPFGLSEFGRSVLDDERYYVVDMSTGDIEVTTLFDLCRCLDIDPVQPHRVSIADWIEQLDIRVVGEQLKQRDWIEFRTLDEAREWVAEHVAKHVSLDNGLTFLSADEAIDDIESRGLWDAVVNAMDDDVREYVHNEMAPCSNKEFLERYLVLAYDDLVI